MNYWIRCSNCGKVAKYPYPSDVIGDIEANIVVSKQVEMDGWIFSHNKEFCCEACEKECLEHYENTGNWLNLPAAYNYQQKLKDGELNGRANTISENSKNKFVN